MPPNFIKYLKQTNQYITKLNGLAIFNIVTMIHKILLQQYITPCIVYFIKRNTNQLLLLLRKKSLRSSAPVPLYNTYFIDNYIYIHYLSINCVKPLHFKPTFSVVFIIFRCPHITVNERTKSVSYTAVHVVATWCVPC